MQNEDVELTFDNDDFAVNRHFFYHGFIECQSALTNMYIGMSTMKAAGCEVIATYNAIRAVEGLNNQRNLDIIKVRRISLSNLIEEYEKDGIMRSGKFGVAPGAIVDLLRRLGYDTDTIIPEKKEYDITSFINKAKAIIMTYYNDGEDLMKEIHTIAITKSAGELTAHNVYCNGYVHGPFKSVEELISTIGEGRAKPIMYIGIL